MSLSELEQEAVASFKQYLRIESVQPAVDYAECAAWLRRQADRLGLPLRRVELPGGAPVLVITWSGSQPELPSVLLSSHMDVVPVYPELWSHPPFGAEQDEEGRIFGRGAQDMKSVGVQYLEAVRRLTLRGYRPLRTVHLCFTPDEEVGTVGMKAFVQTEAFAELNVGCGMDEGVASADETFFLFYGERTNCSLSVACRGVPGHGSVMTEGSAGEKIAKVVNAFMERRAEEMRRLKDDPSLSMGDVTSINLTKLEGGVQTNVVPPELTVVFDCRVSLDEPLDGFLRWAQRVCGEAGEGVTLRRLQDARRVEPTGLGPDNPWWAALRGQFAALGLTVRPLLCPATSDARHLRALGIPVFGFSPMNHTPMRIHEHDEFLSVDVFLKGIEIYEKLIPALASV